MIPVLQLDLRMNQGSRFEQPLNVIDGGQIKDLTNYTAQMQIREFKDSNLVIAEYTTQNGRISIAPQAGQVVIVVPGTITADYDYGDAVYDLKIIDSQGEPIRVMEGKISLNREVTR